MSAAHILMHLRATFSTEESVLQLNLINSKSSGLVVLFGIISILKEVDIKIYNQQKMIIIRFFSIKHNVWVRKRNVSERRFFFAPKTYELQHDISNNVVYEQTDQSLC